jgi:hypothetical protein
MRETRGRAARRVAPSRGTLILGTLVLAAIGAGLSACTPEPSYVPDDDLCTGRCDGGFGDDVEPPHEAGEDDHEMYASREPAAPERRHPIALAPGASTSIPLQWRSAEGLAPTTDLSVEAGGHPVLQVASVGSQPFVRAGLVVEPLDPGAPYDLVLTRSADSVSVAIVRAGSSGPNAKSSHKSGGAVDRDLILLARARVEEGRIADNTAIADVVLPAPKWRASIVADFPESDEARN